MSNAFFVNAFFHRTEGLMQSKNGFVRGPSMLNAPGVVEVHVRTQSGIRTLRRSVRPDRYIQHTPAEVEAALAVTRRMCGERDDED